MADQLDFLARNAVNLLIGFPNHRPGGLLLSILLCATSLALGMILAIVLSSAQRSRWKLIRLLTTVLVRAIQGVPLVLLLLIVHQALGQFVPSLGRWSGSAGLSLIAALTTLVFYAASYQVDIVASGIRTVPSAVIEDARILGGTARRVHFTVTLPYGLRLMRPALLSQAITLFKDSSVVVVLGVADLTTTARLALGSDVVNAPFWVTTYLAVGFMYFIVAFGASQLEGRSAFRPVLTSTTS